jgi:predicted DsbA family dithiol-disulfide isomerase
VFGDRAAKGRLTMDKSRSIDMAAALKLDANVFRDCMQNDRTLARVQADANEGRAVGVRGTPSFLINGILFVGAQPWEAFQQEIEAALNQ